MRDPDWEPIGSVSEYGAPPMCRAKSFNLGHVASLHPHALVAWDRDVAPHNPNLTGATIYKGGHDTWGIRGDKCGPMMVGFIAMIVPDSSSETNYRYLLYHNPDDPMGVTWEYSAKWP